MRGTRQSSQKIKQIETLRKKGYSLLEISESLHIPKSTAFRYIKNIVIKPEFLKEWSVRRGGSRKRRLEKEQAALEEGKKLVGILSNKEIALFISALYWAEGSKKDFGLSNTDANLIKVFVEGLKIVFNIEKDQLKVSIRIYEDLDRNVCLEFWSKVVGIPREKFVNVNVLPGKKKGKLLYGMCRVRVVKGGDLLKKIVGINTALYAQMPL